MSGSSFPFSFPISFSDDWVLLSPVALSKFGIGDLASHSDALSGNAAGTDFFYFPNDGRVILAVIAGASPKTITFTPRVNPYQRIESLIVAPEANKTAMYGPFAPDNWNNENGWVKFQPADGGDSGDKYLAVKIPPMISL